MTTEAKIHARVSHAISQPTAQAGTSTRMPTAAAAASAPARAVSVVEAVQLAGSAGRVWAAIDDFSAWQSWHPAFASTRMLQGDGRSKGAVRVLVTQDGGQFTEELVDFDAAARRYQYRIIESPAPVADYVSTVQVSETTAGCTVTWSSRFNVKPGTPEADAKRLISAVYRAGLDNLASVIG